MATNCPQHVKPRACRSAYVRFTSAWNSVRGNRLRSGLNMLENRVTGEPPWWWRVEACRPRHHHTPRGLTRSQTLIWTRVIDDHRGVVARAYVDCVAGGRGAHSGLN